MKGTGQRILSDLYRQFFRSFAEAGTRQRVAERKGLCIVMLCEAVGLGKKQLQRKKNLKTGAGGAGKVQAGLVGPLALRQEAGTWESFLVTLARPCLSGPPLFHLHPEATEQSLASGPL